MTDKEKDHSKKTQVLPVKTGLKSRTIQVDYLARVEGEGSLTIEIEKDKVTNVQLKIFEPPRFFESFLQGRDMLEAPDITARICGICPVAYQMSAVQAVEDALTLQVPESIQTIRRLLYCGEWVESHALHVYMLHAPDFLGYDDAISMAKDHPDIVKMGLSIKKWGNEIIKLFGGREVHPINVRVGGFYKIPSKAQRHTLLEHLKPARDQALKAIGWMAKLNFPESTLEEEYVALSHPTEYPMGRGDLVSTQGLQIKAQDFEKHIQEFQVKHSTALHAKLIERDNYLVGPLARYNLNQSKLSKLVLETIKDIQFESYCTNPFRSILVRSLEILYAFDEAIRILADFPEPDSPFVEPTRKKALGFAITEAPRGILYHGYALTDEGLIEKAKIIPPTSQNQYTIEKDLTALVKQNIHLTKDKLTWLCEQAIRNYDPCISCSTHFLKVHYKHAK